MEAHTFNSSRWTSEFEASLDYRPSSKIARATQRNSVLQNKKLKESRNILNYWWSFSLSLYGRHCVETREGREKEVGQLAMTCGTILPHKELVKTFKHSPSPSEASHEISPPILNRIEWEEREGEEGRILRNHYIWPDQDHVIRSYFLPPQSPIMRVQVPILRPSHLVPCSTKTWCYFHV